MVKRNEEFSIKDIISLFIPKVWIIVICALVFSFIFGGYAAFIKDDTYTSSAKMHVIKQTSSQISSSDIDFVSKVIDDYKVLITTDMFLNYVIQDIESEETYISNKWNISKSYIKGHMSTSAITDDILQISVTTDNPAKSHLIATAVSEVIRDRSRELFAFGDTLTVKIVHASTPNSANSKNVVRNLFIGFVGGAVGSMLVIFLVAMFDIVVRDKKKLEDTFGLPIIGLIPRFDVEEEES